MPHTRVSPRSFDWEERIQTLKTFTQFSFSSDFGYLILKMLVDVKLRRFERKIHWNITISEEHPTLIY